MQATKMTFAARHLFEDGDVIVDATGKGGFVTQSVDMETLYVRTQDLGLFGTACDLEELEYPVTIVARHGDPTVNIVVRENVDTVTTRVYWATING